MKVSRLWRHPVKSMRGEEVAALDIRSGGVAGDRVYSFVDADTGERISAKRHGALLGCAARLLTEPGPGGPDAGDPPPFEVTFPDGSVVRDDPPEVTRRVAALLGVEVRLVTGAPGTLVDAAPLHVLAASTLRALAVEHPAGDWDPRRTRPNIVVDDLSEPEQIDVDDEWLSCDLHIGATAIAHIVIPTSRCVMTTLGQGDLPADPDVLRTLNRVRRRRIGRKERPCVGVYAAVVASGHVRVDDPVVVGGQQNR